MKHLCMIVMMTFAMTTGFAGIPTQVIAKAENKAPLKKVDITVHVNGYTIRIVGTINYNVWSGNVSINAVLIISGNGANIEVPYVYNGSLSKGKGTNTYKYDMAQLAEEDKEPVSLVISHIFLPADKDPKKIKVE